MRSRCISLDSCIEERWKKLIDCTKIGQIYLFTDTRLARFGLQMPILYHRNLIMAISEREIYEKSSEFSKDCHGKALIGKN